MGWWGPRPRLLCGCELLRGLILFHFACFGVRFWVLVGASPSPPLWLWAPLGAVFVQFRLFWVRFWGAGGRLALASSVVVGPFGA